MSPEEYIELYKRYLAGTASPQEIEKLFAYKDEFDVANFDNDEQIINQDQIKDRIYSQITGRLDAGPKRKTFGRFWWPVAASLLLISAAGWYFIKGHQEKISARPTLVAVQHSDIVPGTNKAILVLGNGETVDLRQTANGHIAKAGDVKVNKVKEGQLAYDKNQRGERTEQISYNTIITPKGGQYAVILPDGTSVWLNSASSLKFPTAFNGSERHVELTGEAYFEVAKNKAMPFTVAAGKVNVRVLGTHFNVAAYNDDPSSKTTLLEGAVLLSDDKKQQVALTPGQQGIVRRDGEPIQLKDVNVEDAIAWKKGYFSFRKETVEGAMRKMARWYDVEVEYQGKVSHKKLGGTVSRTQNIEEILAYLELTGIAHFEIKGRRIIVKGS